MILKKILCTALAVLITAGIAFSASAASDKDYTIAEAYWDEGESYVAGLWDETEDKTSYKVQLYKGTKKIGSLQTTNKAKMVFSKLIADNGSGSYHFTVYPTKGGKNMLVRSETIVIESDYLAAIKKNLKSTSNTTGNTGGTSGSGQSGGPGVAASSVISPASGIEGWNRLANGSWWWKNTDGSIKKEDWLLDKENWYYFDQNGIMQTGWIKYRDLWYYCGADGAMLKDTTTPDGFKVNADGVWVEN